MSWCGTFGSMRRGCFFTMKYISNIKIAQKDGRYDVVMLITRKMDEYREMVARSGSVDLLILQRLIYVDFVCEYIDTMTTLHSATNPASLIKW